MLQHKDSNDITVVAISITLSPPFHLGKNFDDIDHYATKNNAYYERIYSID